MPVSVVVGGQFGSEGKGKVALEFARATGASAVVRVGGTNSGHTGIADNGTKWILRQIPASALWSNALIVLPPGSLIDPEILEREVGALSISPERLVIDARASVITADHKRDEEQGGLVGQIGSTASGTGAALRDRLARRAAHQLAGEHPYLKRFSVESTASILRRMLQERKRVVVEGTQGFGLSLWHSSYFPYSTSRDTTASAFLSESGLSPIDVDQVILVIRTFPIRVGGNSGPLRDEINWQIVADEAKLPKGFEERTSATNRVRRVGRFDATLVRSAIEVNNPTHIVLNHLDYIEKNPGHLAKEFVESVELSIGRRVDYLGFDATKIIRNPNEIDTVRLASAC
ncbi:adenylosuccinate synthetase [Mesorhizobium sp. BR115XR7A]|uniref:adenylosuccinate synthetase n=1 Tax=Mesorhizobium sp. BR115XR7A TaxID=2876645 RepID=UPI001CCEC28B|nr:adenylosuccinate synthetase [Mesorhizobium sp. BR115XR7A]MBZ9906220.1 adenylosuccinate synthetase [Mesorhizobium sp. BR115XR7A]MBZ9933415.1 adenylosuccinate synthetase [Mesorhizobium sp. BR1-1-5]